MSISGFAALLLRRPGGVNAFFKPLMAVMLDQRPVGVFSDVFWLCHS
jgi:hypothetical protein